MLEARLPDDQIPRGARNAVSKDGYDSWAERKISYRDRGKACVRPAPDRINGQESNLAVVDAAQLHDWVVARRILGVAARGLRDALEV